MENQLRQITKEELDNILEQHKLWLETSFSDDVKGQCANLSYADLRGANLIRADLSYANLHGADLSHADLRGADLNYADLRDADLSYANLSNANLRDANLIRADLSYADLRGADLSYADLHGADLSHADLSGANLIRADLSGVNLDFSCFPLWCGGLKVHIDDKQAIQLLYHLIRNVQFSKNTSNELKALLLQPQIIEKANEFHRVSECGKIEFKEEVEQ